MKAVNYIGAAGISASEGTALFVNGTTFEQNGHVDVGRWSSCPTISVSNMRLVARDCVFRGNRAKNDNGNGLVVVKAGNNGNNSQIKDCLFIGNEHLGSAGMVILESNWNNFTLEVSGCTFAYNVIGSSSALYLMGGVLGNAPKTATCAVRDCIFWGNVADSGMTKGVDIRAADVKAICNLSYSLFGGTEAEKTYDYYSPTMPPRERSRPGRTSS